MSPLKVSRSQSNSRSVAGRSRRTAEGAPWPYSLFRRSAVTIRLSMRYWVKIDRPISAWAAARSSSAATRSRSRAARSDSNWRSTLVRRSTTPACRQNRPVPQRDGRHGPELDRRPLSRIRFGRPSPRRAARIPARLLQDDFPVAEHGHRDAGRGGLPAGARGGSAQRRLDADKVRIAMRRGRRPILRGHGQFPSASSTGARAALSYSFLSSTRSRYMCSKLRHPRTNRRRIADSGTPCPPCATRCATRAAR